MRTKLFILCCLLAAASLVAGCGNKGDLYRTDTSAGKSYKPG